MTVSALPDLTSFVGGESIAGGGGRLDLVAPGDGRVHARLVEAGEEGVAKAVSDSLRAFRENRRSTLHGRSLWLRAMAAALASKAEDFAFVLCQDVGKPLRAARFESKRGAEFLEACASAALQVGGEVVPVDAAPLGAGHLGFTRRVPYGVVGAITPFNAPINLLVQKIGPAIAAGNAIVAKPAPSGTRAPWRSRGYSSRRGCPRVCST